MADTCYTCIFWDKFDDYTNLGDCRRFPPTKNGFAQTLGRVWCGEYRFPTPGSTGPAADRYMGRETK